MNSTFCAIDWFRLIDPLTSSDKRGIEETDASQMGTTNFEILPRLAFLYFVLDRLIEDCILADKGPLYC